MSIGKGDSTMPRLNIKDITPPPDAIWQCPCGFTAEYRYLPGHRKGKKNNPGCVGKLRAAPRGSFISYGPHEGWFVGDDGKPVERLKPTYPEPVEPTDSTKQPDTSPDSPKIEAYEFTGDEGTLDPEEIARQFNERRQLDDSAGLPDAGGEIPVGDYVLEPPVGPPQVSNLKESVSLPVIVRVMYDWAKSKGWNKGDGSLSAFVTDILLDYWHNCMGMVVLVAKRDELGIDTPWMEERSLVASPEGNGKSSVDK